MPASRYGQLLLPSGQLGLRAYDVLEEAVFLGPGKHGVSAQPMPFPKAEVALTWDGETFVARALPGSPAPQVNGAEAEAARLKDGDRLSIAGEAILIRLQAPPGPAPAAASSPSATEERRPAAARRVLTPTSAGWNHATWVLGLLGLGLLLTAGVLAVEHVSDLKAFTRARAIPLPEPAVPRSGEEDRLAREYAKAEAYELAHPEAPDGAVQVWLDFLARNAPAAQAVPGPEVLAAAARLEALHEVQARQAWEVLERQARDQLSRGRFGTPLEQVLAFEARFGATAAAQGVPALRADLTQAARAAFEALKAKVEPLLVAAPRQAHAAILTAGLELPPDLGAEAAALLERAVEGMRKRGSAPPPEPGSGGSPSPGSPAPGAPSPAPSGEQPRAPAPAPRQPGPAPTPTPAPPAPAPGPTPAPAPAPTPAPAAPGDPESAARAAWVAAREHLLAGRGKEALAAYDAVLRDHAATALVRDGQVRIKAGQRAARALVTGPAALLSVPAQTKRGHLEVEYTFDDPRVLAEDWSVEKPFATDLPQDGVTDKGEVVLKGGTGLMHTLVFALDAHVEADVTAVVAKDFGLLCVEESDRYRALLLDLANTRFKLKKGDAARPQPGHLLWFIGEGVWAAADPGEHGFIKLAERSTSRLENGDRGMLELSRNGDRLEGGYQGKTDGVFLEGTVRGDDGKGMGAGRVGVFVNGGELRVKRVKISGTVDPAWWARRLKDLAAGDPGPL